MAQHTLYTRSFAKANEKVSAAHKRGFIVPRAAPRVELCARHGKSPRWKSVKELFFLPGCTREKLHLALAGLKGVSFLVKVRFLLPKPTFHPAALQAPIRWHNQNVGLMKLNIPRDFV